MKKRSIALICLVVLSIVGSWATVTICHADNPRPRSPDPGSGPIVETSDNPRPRGSDPIVEPLDNPRPR